MADRWVFEKLENIGGHTDVYRLARGDSVGKPWRGVHVWWGGQRAYCTECSSPLAAMSSSCVHSKALKRHMTRKAQP